MNKILFLPRKSEMVEATWQALRNRPAHITLRGVSESTGLSRGWLSMFNQRRIDNPSYESLQILYNFLISL